MDLIYLLAVILIHWVIYKRSIMNLSATFLSIALLGVLGYSETENTSAGYFICLINIILALVSSYKHGERKRIYAKVNDHLTAKSWVHVLGKVVLIIVAAAFQNNLLFLALLSYGLADSLASKIGIFSKSKTISIITLREVLPGTNGGISFLGITLGILGGLFMTLIAIFFFPKESSLDILTYCLIGALIGNILDSILGELIENKFRLYGWVNNLLTELLIVAICTIIQII
jgi:uncharacterized protein (TIGR00297 family)